MDDQAEQAALAQIRADFPGVEVTVQRVGRFKKKGQIVDAYAGRDFPEEDAHYGINMGWPTAVGLLEHMRHRRAHPDWYWRKVFG